jgi:hypothetical protein
MHNKEISSEKVTFLGGGKKKESSKRKRSEWRQIHRAATSEGAVPMTRVWERWRSAGCLYCACRYWRREAGGMCALLGRICLPPGRMFLRLGFADCFEDWGIALIPAKQFRNLFQKLFTQSIVIWGHAVEVKTLRYKREGRGFDTRWGDCLNLPNPSGRIGPWGLLSL